MYTEGVSVTQKTSVLFVCLGNICRSPTAHGVFEQLVERQGASERFLIDSAGTAAYHVGKAPDPRTQAAARRRGYPLEHLRARAVDLSDFDSFDYILAMDAANLRDLRSLCPRGFRGHLGLFLDFAEGVKHKEVPDPYYSSGEQGFEEVLDLVEKAGQGLYRHLIQESCC